MQLNKEDLTCLIKGASILTTGGGLCLQDQLESLNKRDTISLNLLDLNEFKDDDLLITASEVGTADAKEMDKTEIIPKMLCTWEKLTGKKIAGVYAPELGQESIIIDTAIGLGAPLIDFDVAGGRAVPFVDINSINVAGIKYSMAPLVAATDQGNIIAIDSDMDISDIETFLRQLSRLSRSGIAFFIGGAIRAGDIIGAGVDNRSLSLSLKLGSLSNLEDIKNLLQPQIILSGNVVEKREINKSGFNCYEAIFKHTTGAIYTLFIQNEALLITDENGNTIVTPPDKICIVDEKNLCGISTKDLLSGKKTSLLCISADPIWKTPRGLNIFGKDRFI